MLWNRPPQHRMSLPGCKSSRQLIQSPQPKTRSPQESTQALNLQPTPGLCSSTISSVIRRNPSHCRPVRTSTPASDIRHITCSEHTTSEAHLQGGTATRDVLIGSVSATGARHKHQGIGPLVKPCVSHEVSPHELLIAELSSDTKTNTEIFAAKYPTRTFSKRKKLSAQKPSAPKTVPLPLLFQPHTPQPAA